MVAALVVLRIIIALTSLAGALAAGFVLVLIMSFRTSHLRDTDIFAAALALGIVIFAFCFLCSIGLFKRWLAAARVGVAAACVPVAALLLTEGKEGAWASAGLAFYTFLFWAMCRGIEARS